jgi:hypothetical protein
MNSLVAAPLMQTAYPMQLTSLVQPLIRVVLTGGDAAETACNALRELAHSPPNFALLVQTPALVDALVELRDYEGHNNAGLLIAYLEEYQEKVVISGGGVLWRPVELLARAACEDESIEFRRPKIEPEVVRSHVHKDVQELAEEIDDSSHRCHELLGILPGISEEDVSQVLPLWSDIKSIDDAEARLTTLVDYCERGGCYGVGMMTAAPECTTKKLRMVTQLFTGQNPIQKLSMLLLLAAHGGVCNVQKEVGIDAAYAQMTRTCSELAERSSFEAHVFRLLRQKREQVVEELSIEFCRRIRHSTNTHILVPFRNLLAHDVGIRNIPDPNAASDLFAHEDGAVADSISRFWHLYSFDAILGEVAAALNEMPRRIPYDSLISWLKIHVPFETDVYSFLSASFDVNGHIRHQTIEYALCYLGILQSPNTFTASPGMLKMQIGPQEWSGLDAYIVLAQRWKFVADAEKCSKVLTNFHIAIAHSNAELLDEHILNHLRCSLAEVEAELCNGPHGKLLAYNWLVAGALVSIDPASQANSLSEGFPKIKNLLKEAYQLLKK